MAGNKTEIKVSKIHVLPPSKSLINDHNENNICSAIVELECKEQQRALLNAARRHDPDLDEFEGVFMHEDRTKIQQTQYRETANEAKRLNENLKKIDKLDKPFRFVVRANRVRCIDMDQSREQKKSIYCSPPALDQLGHHGRPFIQLDDTNVNNTRGNYIKRNTRGNKASAAHCASRSDQ